MARYKVTFIKYETYEIDAETEQEAENIATEKIRTYNRDMKYFDEVEVEKIKDEE